MNSYYHFFSKILYVFHKAPINKNLFTYYIYKIEIISNPSAWITVFEGIISNHHSLVNHP
jgi:hypothetical protein